MESKVNFSFRYKAVFHSLPVVNPETIPISKIELFTTIGSDFQSLTIVVKISAYNYQTWLLALLTFLASFKLQVFNVSDRFWTDSKHLSDRLFVFIRKKKDPPDMLIG